MIVKKVVLYNFRNYKNQEIEFENKLNFIIGKNAQGKTNIIESIYYASYGKSFRNTKDIQLINHNEKNSFFGINYEYISGTKKIEFKLNDEKKKEIKINGVPITKTSELVGEFNAIVFSPDDLKIIKEGPSLRRKFIDREISQMSKIYYNNLIQYYKVLEQRNNYLKKMNIKNIDKIYMETIDEQLVKYGKNIMIKRIEIIEKLNYEAIKIHKNLSDEKELLSIKYVSSVMKQNILEYDKIEENFLNLLKENLEKDLNYNFTSIGPHRDDINININEKDLKIYGSQGQIRTAALSMILGILNIIIDELDENPVLLLDDVFSELDQKRKNLLLKFIEKIQTFITATDLDGIDKEILKNSSIYIVDNGTIRRN
ncbi:MAG: DNA replication/repair protein RecF [Clostridiales bacterium]|nr:DNA replication/repair protein RecF [Clostridiales bacterium]